MLSREPATLQDVVDALSTFGGRPAVGLREDIGLRWWSYERLHRNAHGAAALLRDAGVGRGDRVLIRGRNSPEWVAFLLGSVMRGAAAVPVDHDASPDLVGRVAAVARPKLIVASADAPGLAELAPVLRFDALHDRAAPIHDGLVEPVAADDAAIVFFTSGTTAEPRPVGLTHGNVVAQIARFRRWRFLASTLGARMLVMSPLSHVQGFVLGVVIPLTLGLSAIYTTSSHPAHLVRLLRDNRVSVLCTVPRVLQVLRKHFESLPYGRGRATLGDKLRDTRTWMLRRHFVFTHMRRRVGYSSLWVVLVGGAPLPEADEEFWRVSGCLLAQGYGLTETAGIVSVNVPLFGPFGSVGRPLRGQEVRIAPDGEILVRGANVTASRSRDTAAEEGFLRTGDIGRLDGRSRLFILGRTKEVIVTGEGFNVLGAEVEAALNACPGVEDSVVLGVEHGGHMGVHAVLQLSPGTDAAAVVSRANQRLEPYQRVAGWTVWPGREFPRSALLKPRRSEIARQIAAGGEGPVAGAAARSLDDVLAIEEPQQRIAAMARYIVADGVEDAADARLVEDAGLSSLDIVELLGHIERESGRTLDRAAVDEAVTVSRLRTLVAAPEGEPGLGRLEAADAPRWAELSGLTWLRRALNPAVLDTLVHWQTRLTVSGQENLAGLEPPAVFVGVGHEHGFDVLLIHCALPARLRRRLAVVASRWVFTQFFAPQAGTSLAQRLLVGAGFHFIVPLFFPFVLSSPYARSRETLMEACRLIDRGFSVIAFEGKGIEVVARQCGVPIVPVRIGNRERTWFRARLARAPASVHFERPISPDRAPTPDEVKSTPDAVPSAGSEEIARG